MKYPYLSNEAFLKEIDNLQDKQQYVKIIALNWEEKPIQEIQGTVSTGSLNLNGKSSVRRTGSLTMLADENSYDILNIKNIIAINKKIQLEIGFLNTTTSYLEYPIIWMPLGLFVIGGAAVARSTSGLNISINLKDKMSLLNGECGGTLPAAVTFNKVESLDEKGNIIINNVLVAQIIYELVTEFGHEQGGKVIIKDVDSRIKRIVRWAGDREVYSKSGPINTDLGYGFDDNLSYIPPKDGSQYHTYTFGDDVGYVMSNFYYPQDLIGNAGDSVCTVLDKIVKFLGNYEYYYDIDGNFIFQEIKNYLNTTKASTIIEAIQQIEDNAENYILDYNNNKSVYSFLDDNLITAYNFSPQYNSIKNDFVVWGIRQSASGQKIPIRYHLAIDNKPETGNIYGCNLYTDYNNNIVAKTMAAPAQGEESCYIVTSDWRTELYLQGIMSLRNGTYPGYYYPELATEWPKICNLKATEIKDKPVSCAKVDGFKLIIDFAKEDGIENHNMILEKNNFTTIDTNSLNITDASLKFYQDKIKDNLNSLDYFLDFIDTTSAINDFNVNSIGRRAKVVNSNDVNCIFPIAVPNRIIIQVSQNTTEAEREEAEKMWMPYIQVEPSIYDALATGGVSNSAFDYIRDLLYQSTSYNASISITCIPIYHLEPNTRITVDDIVSGIHGDYVINSISLPLTTNGTSTIQCTKALERI